MGLVSTQFLQYPSMERQDLTQGQLGSFKFTPVDAVYQDADEGFLSAFAHQEMISQLQASAQRAIAMASDTRNNLHFAMSFETGLTAPTGATHFTRDLDFFGKHIKSDIGDSRLKYGPAALRSAVESHSPGKSRNQHQKLESSRAFAYNNTNMNPNASDFVSAAPASSLDFDNANITIQALCRSLVAEQHAHHVTQLTLEDALSKLAEVEADMRKMMNLNKSLTSAVDMLGSIIKHNQHKLAQTNITSTQQFSDDGFMNAEVEPVKDVTPIIHDALERQRASLTSTEMEVESAADSIMVNGLETKRDDDTQAFNLDLIKSPAHDDTGGSSLCRTLRRHFFESPDDDRRERSNQLKTPTGNATKLISLSPEELEKAPVRSITPLIAASQKLQQENYVRTPNPYKHMPNLSETPVPNLPASFLAKYKAPPKHRKVVHDDSPETTARVQTDTKSTPTTPTGSPPPSYKSSALSTPTRQRIARLPQLVDLRIRWKVKGDNPIFQDEQEKTIALGHQNSEVNLRNSFWEHPVRYIEYADENLFRTVMIDHIPEGSSVKDVLREVCGGSLEKIELFPPIGAATNFMTARIVFNNELSAITVVDHARNHGMKIKGQLVRVWQVLTQTYPKNRQLYEYVFTHCYTRVLIITNVADQQLGTIQAKLAQLRKFIAEYGRTHDDLPMIEFTSITAAVRALKVLMNDPDLGGAELDFEDDPCAKPYPQSILIG